MWDRLAVRLTAGFLLAALIGVMLVAVLAYRSTTEEFGSFVGHMRMMQQMMGDPGFAEAQRDFLDNLGRTLWIAGASGLAAALILGGAVHEAHRCAAESRGLGGAWCRSGQPGRESGRAGRW
jgi:ABC-type Fe3+ transport system permease subunit